MRKIENFCSTEGAQQNDFEKGSKILCVSEFNPRFKHTVSKTMPLQKQL